MRIVNLKAENIKRLKAVEITPEGDVITIGGKNKAGKSSVLDTIAYALGGQALVPEEPIRKGETKAEIQVDLGDVIVTRKFTREVIADGDKTSYGPTKSTLTVKSRDNASYPSPQAMLDKLLGDLTFDPREFATQKPSRQLEILREITNLDTTLIDNQRREAVSRRTMLKRSLEVEKANIEKLPELIADVPLEELSMEEVSAEMARIEGLRSVAHEKLEKFRLAESDFKRADEARVQAMEEVNELRRRLSEAEERLKKATEEANNHVVLVTEAQKLHASAVSAIPPTEDLQKRIAEIEETNKKVKSNRRRLEAQKSIEELQEKVAEETALIAVFDEKKQNLISSIEFPVPGLGFGEDGVLLNGLPFEQASTSEQLSVSVAIGLALNPKLRVLLIRNGESLDSESMALIAKLAEENKAQLWVERMTESKDGVTVMIEDGEVV